MAFDVPKSVLWVLTVAVYQVSISSMVPALGLLRLESLRSTSSADSDVEEDCSEEVVSYAARISLSCSLKRLKSLRRLLPPTENCMSTATKPRRLTWFSASAPTKEDGGDGEDSEEDIDGWEDLGATEEFGGALCNTSQSIHRAD